MNKQIDHNVKSQCICTDPFSLASFTKQLANHRVVAYMRGDGSGDIAAQKKLIDDFCDQHGYRVVDRQFDFGEMPGPGFQQAIENLKEADVLIVSDLQRLVAHPQCRGRELRPLLHQFLCKQGKHLIAVAEGINTCTTAGQIVAMEFVTQLKDAEDPTAWFDRS